MCRASIFRFWRINILIFHELAGARIDVSHGPEQHGHPFRKCGERQVFASISSFSQQGVGQEIHNGVQGCFFAIEQLFQVIGHRHGAYPGSLECNADQISGLGPIMFIGF